MKEFIKDIEARDIKYRNYIEKAKKEGNHTAVKYFQGHIHEIEYLLFLLKEMEQCSEE